MFEIVESIQFDVSVNRLFAHGPESHVDAAMMKDAMSFEFVTLFQEIRGEADGVLVHNRIVEHARIQKIELFVEDVASLRRRKVFLLRRIVQKVAEVDPFCLLRLGLERRQRHGRRYSDKGFKLSERKSRQGQDQEEEMFDGREDRFRRQIRLGGRSNDNRNVILQRANAEREERAAVRRRQESSVKLSSWWRGRRSAQETRQNLRETWLRQMDDTERLMTILQTKSPSFQLPPKVVVGLARMFFFAHPDFEAVDHLSRFKDRLCALLMKNSNTFTELSAILCRNLIWWCLATVEAGDESDRGVFDVGRGQLFSRDAAGLAYLWTNQRACDVATRVAPGKGRELAIAVAIESVRVATDERELGRPPLRENVLATFGAQLAEIVDERIDSTFADHVGPIFRSMANNFDRLVAGKELAFLSRICRAAQISGYAVETIQLALVILPTMPKSVFLNAAAAAAENDRRGERVGARGRLSVGDGVDDREAKGDVDSDDSSEDSASEEEERKDATTSTRSRARAYQRPSLSMVLLDALVVGALGKREEKLSSSPGFEGKKIPSNVVSALVSMSFWQGLFAAAAAAAEDENRRMISTCVFAATVVALCDPAPRARVALISSRKRRITSALFDAAASNQNLVRRLWALARESLVETGPTNRKRPLHQDEERNEQQLLLRSSTSSSSSEDVLNSATSPLVLFCCIFSHLLASLDDDAISEGGSFLSHEDIRDLAGCLRDALRRELWLSRTLTPSVPLPRLYSLGVCARLFNQLYDRLSKAPRSKLFIDDPDFWTWNSVNLSGKLAADDEDGDGDDSDEAVTTGEDNDGDVEMTAEESAAKEGKGNLDSVALSSEPRVAQVLAAMPFVIPFHQRVGLFSALVERDRGAQDSHSGLSIFSSASRGHRRPTHIQIRRDHVFDDAFQALKDRASSSALKARIQVTFVNAAGHAESGIDGGGLFKEFLDELAKTGLGESGLFETTPDGVLYPKKITSAQANEKMEFCGRVIGKALYERVLVEAPFARFFLNKALGKYNSFDDLASLDRELYDNLLKLKKIDEADFEHLNLTFEITDSARRVDVELFPGGKNVRVDASNRMRYIQLVAHRRLNVDTAAASAAFLKGLRTIIPVRWLRMFDADELQTLISGAVTPIDVDDWMDNVNYTNGYHPSQPYIQWFWDIVKELDQEQRGLLLKFSTSCSRPPLLGFQQLRPKFAIHMVADNSRLPTSSTCMNLFKLPKYADRDTLRDKLLYAIQEARGFELS